MKHVISSVQSAKVTFLKGDPLVMVVTALGTVNSSGWTGGILVPHVYVTQPEDGIQDFTFMADAPDGIRTFGFVDGFGGIGEMPYVPWMRGIRVHAAEGSIEVKLQSDHAEVTSKPLSDDDYWPFPWNGGDHSTPSS